MTQLKTLVILAAGNGSRFGGAKQFACFGEQAKTLMEYNIIHAIDAGFNHVVFITQKQQESQLEQEVIARLPKSLKVDIAIQTFDLLPKACIISSARTKPLGTAHALWCAKAFIKNQFVVINADDYYGKQAFAALKPQAVSTENQLPHYSLVAYHIANTLSEHGGVNRGICEYSKNMQLISIREIEDIQAKIISKSMVISGQDTAINQIINLPDSALVSMNFWAFETAIFSAIEQELIKTFTASSANNVECYLPSVVMSQLRNQQATVNILTSSDDWFGVTYAADSAWVNDKINQLFSLQTSPLAY